MISFNIYAINSRTRYSEWMNLSKSYRSVLKKSNRASLTPDKISKYSNFSFKIKYLRREILKNRLDSIGNVCGWYSSMDRGISVDKCGRLIVSNRLKPDQKILVAIHILNYASIYDER